MNISIQSLIKFNLFILFSIGLMIPQHWDFGINLGVLKLYFEDIITIILIILIILMFFKKYKIPSDSIMILLLDIVILFFSILGMINHHNIIIIFKDIRILLELTIILFAISLIQINRKDWLLLLYLIVFCFTIYVIQYLYSIVFETYLLNMIDISMSMGFKRIILGNNVALIFMLPFIYFINKKIFYYLFILVTFISLLSMKRTDIGLLLILSILYIKKFNLKYLLIAVVFSSILIFIVLNLELSNRFINIMDGSANTRLYSIIIAYSNFLEHPILGFGFGKEMEVTIKSIGGVDLFKNFIDNSYLTILIKTGIIGFIVYIVVIFKLINQQHHKSVVVFFFLFFFYGFFSAYMIIGSRVLLYSIPFAYLAINNLKYKKV